jgi:hypothetical protein
MSKQNTKSKTDNDVDFLLKTIDEKNEQMTRLQNKFRGDITFNFLIYLILIDFLLIDVTHAYKSLIEEKKALEITIKALKTSKTLTVPSINNNNKQTESVSGIFSSSRSVSTSDLSEQESTVSDSDNTINLKLQQAANLSNQEDKIAALTSNIQLLISNKSKLEQNFQAERKKLRSDYDELNQKFETNKIEAEKQAESYEQRIKEVIIKIKHIFFLSLN